MNWIESFFNFQNDWHWGPFEFLRPAKKESIGWRRSAAIWAASIPAIVFGIFLILVARWVYRFDIKLHHLPTWQFVWAAICWIAHGYVAIAMLGAVLFPFLWWPYALAWNRRAARLRRSPSSSPDEFTAGVWPPPPSRA